MEGDADDAGVCDCDMGADADTDADAAEEGAATPATGEGVMNEPPEICQFRVKLPCWLPKPSTNR